MDTPIKDRKLVKLIKLLIWISPIILFGWILSRHFVLSGHMEILYDVTKSSDIVKNFASKEDYRYLGAINLPGSQPNSQLITRSPIYFDVKVPRVFAEAKVSFKYLNPDGQKEMILGVKQPNEAYYYQKFVFENSILEGLEDHWISIEDEGTILWQKDIDYFNAKKAALEELDKKWDQLAAEDYGLGYEKLDSDKKKQLLDNKKSSILYELDYNEVISGLKQKKNQSLQYSTVDDFINNLPPTDEVIQFNYPIYPTVKLPDYQPSNELLVISQSLRGSHEIWTYIGEYETLDYKFIIQDSNRHAGADIFTVTVFDIFDNKVGEIISPDDGEAVASGKIIEQREVDLKIENLPIGTYKLRLSIAQDDIFIKKIITRQHKLFFRNKIYLVDNIEYKDILGDKELLPANLLTNSTYIKARTAHDNGLQVIKAGWQNLNIDTKHELKKVELGGGLSTIKVPLNDIYIEGNGFFVFAENQIFDPDYGVPENVNNVDDPDDYKYIIAKYPENKNENGWSIAEATIKQPWLYLNDNGHEKYINFIISLPNLNEENRKFIISEVSISLDKDPITLNNFFSKLTNWLKRNK